MQTGLPDPAALDEAFTLLWPLPLALSLSDLLYQGPISPTIPAKHREVVVGGTVGGLGLSLTCSGILGSPLPLSGPLSLRGWN